ncbi:unnamed protein product [Linum tenue]|uniref:Polymerase nucleotidyl transferase domain-containing protein n=1 Tax=Linum tenue TaxID=586396 RepID=A0AAV0PI14_9ROSI|nr:unnamed protein product [Linum tenue]
MGEHETPQSQPPSGLLPNGLLPNEAASVMRVLDSARWSKAEERTAELMECIKPNQPSENQRNAVASYVQRLIMKCFPCQVFTFGSVPLKTYLPDGDIDLTAFSKNQDLKDTWAHQVCDMLENEEKNENAEFQVKQVQYIQAEVKIIKCRVENIAVDISFNQLGGLCTLCFLEEVLYRFLEFFSKFDWDNFCVSLWGPVPIGSLPNVTAEPPRKDGGKLLLAKSFLDACGSVYAVFPNGQESNGHPFISKHFNVIDPLRANNNLGRSVNKGNFFRIRSAFAFGAKKLARLLECDSENIHFEVNQFFQNTWERHGTGHRPDAPLNGFWQLRPSNNDYLLGSENVNLQNIASVKSGSHEGQNNALNGPCIVPSQHGNHALESTSWSSDVATVSQSKSQKMNVKISLRTSDQARREISTNQFVHAEKNLSSSKPDSLVGDLQGRYLYARTHSSPELTDTCNKVSSQARHAKVPESAKGQTTAARSDIIKRQETEPENYFPHGLVSSPVTRHIPTVGLTSSPEGSVEHLNENFGTVGLNPEEADNEFWREHERVSVGGLELDNGSFEMETSDDKQQSTSVRYNIGSSGTGGSGNSSRVQPKFTRGSLHSNQGERGENFLYTENKGDGVLFDERLTNSSSFPTIPSNSVRSTASSESSWDGSSVKSVEDLWKTSTTVTSVVHVKGKGINEGSSSQVDDDSKEWSSQLSTSPEIVERGLGPPATGVSRHLVPGFELAQTSGSDPVVPIPPVLLAHGARFYPTGPPVPFVTMFPIYNFPAAETGTSEASTSQTGSEEGMNNIDRFQNGDLLEGHHDQSEVPSPSSTSMSVAASLEAFEHKYDILNSDFASHWQNLQYGRFCQNSQLPSPVVYPPVAVPPVHLQGRIPWDGPGRPVSPNMKLLSQLMGYGPRILPVAPMQAVSGRPSGVYQHYVDEVPRYRGGTGTYLPDPKVAGRDRHTTNSSRKANYNNYDRSEHHGDYREGPWYNSKSRAPGRSHSRNQADKSSSSRLDILAGTGGSSRSERTWVSHRHDNPTPADQIEFGSLGPMGFAELSHLNEDQRLHGSAVAQLSSPDQPSSPHHLQR